MPTQEFAIVSLDDGVPADLASVESGRDGSNPQAALTVDLCRHVDQLSRVVRIGVGVHRRPVVEVAVDQAVESLDPGHVREAIAGEREVGINIDGRDHTLIPDDLTLVLQPLDGYMVESEAGRAVALALDLDEGLIREGLAREVVRAVQNARKEAGLEITDRITLGLGGDEALLAAARAHSEYLCGETLAASVDYDPEGGEPAVVDGRQLRISVALLEA